MASLDRTVVGEPDLLVEIKTSTSSAWALAPVPQMYLDQVQWQMFCTGARAVDVAVLLSGLVFRIERVEADPVYQTLLFDKAVAFRELVASGTPPPLTGNDSDTLAEVKPQSNNTYAVADPSWITLRASTSKRRWRQRLPMLHSRRWQSPSRKPSAKAKA